MKPAYQSAQDLLLEYSSLAGLSEESARLRTARREINPLHAKDDNPVKKAVRATSKARSSKESGDIAGAVSRTQVASLYARSHGFPNLTKQLGKHKETLRKFGAATRKTKALHTQASRKRRMQDLKAKLKANALRRRLAPSKTRSR